MATADENREALIDAVLRLVRERGLQEISVRDVAREAGVNHGLVHRYFGSRDGLFAEATQRITAELHASYPPDTGLSCYTFRYLRDRPELVRVLAQACIEERTELLAAASPSPERLDQVVGTLKKALGDRSLPGLPDPEVLNALAVSATLGWLLFRPLLDQGFRLPDEADDQIQGLLETLDALAAGFGR